MRGNCPSCRYRLSPCSAECPVCGLSLTPQSLPRPLLFQASCFHQPNPSAPTPSKLLAIATPALGRITPIALPELDPGPQGAPAAASAEIGTLWSTETAPQLPTTPIQDHSLWPLVRMEAAEFLLLAGLNGLFALLVALLAHAPLARAYDQLWPLLVPVHFCLSWAFLMVPLALAGQTPMMGSQGLLLDTGQPEKRLAFSVFHLLSVLLFPLSFLCMVLTQEHRTLAEVLTGQELLFRAHGRSKT